MNNRYHVKHRMLFEAALAHYRAQQAEAMAHLDLCFNSSIAIGEHTDLLAEVKKWTAQLATAEENMVSLQRNFDTVAIV
jgi:hypothetical protein